MSHVNASQESNKLDLYAAPDKDGVNQNRESFEEIKQEEVNKDDKIPVLNQSAEPVIVEYDQDADEEEVKNHESSDDVDPANLVNIGIKATMQSQLAQIAVNQE